MRPHPLRYLAALLLLAVAVPGLAANGCSPYSSYVAKSGQTWFNEYYFGPATTHFLEVFSKNSSVTMSNPSVWNNWRIRVYSKAGSGFEYETYPLSAYTTACTIGGGRTYITYTNPAARLNHNDAMVVVFDGPPDLPGTKEIDALVYSNTAPPTPYTSSYKYYTPTCPELKSTLDSQLASAGSKTIYKGKNILILDNFGTKDISRLPDGSGSWDETTLTGSGTSFTQCVTNDPVDIVKSFTWAPTYTSATSNGTVDPGALVTFTISATNKTKATMNGVKVSDTLPAGLTYAGNLTLSAGATGSCTGTPTVCTLTLPASLAPNVGASMSFQATVSNAPAFFGATLQNTAIQSAGTSLDPPPSADAFITVASGLTMALAATSNTPQPGEQIGFTVTARNDTSYPMAGTIVTIPFPSGLAYDASVTPVVTGGGTATCTAVSCILTLPSPLAAGAEVTLGFKAIVTGETGQSVTVTATQTEGSALTTEPAVSTVISIGTSAAGFNACHNFTATNCSRAAGRLFTRLAGSDFSMDIVALQDDDSVATNYVGTEGDARTVKVELLNADAGNSLITTQNAVFPAGNTTGRVTLTWPALPSAYRNVLVRMTETTGAAPLSSVSSDTFAVRPSGVTIATNATATFSDVNGTPVIKAGQPFTIAASTNPAAGYAGTITLDTSRLSTGNVRLGNLYRAGTSTAFSVQVNASPGPADNATYDEVGYFQAGAGAFRDQTFTAVDRPTGCSAAGTCDCHTSASGASDVSNTIDSSGRLGCYIGNTATVSFARFIPDHFVVKPGNEFTAGHDSCDFTYMDQPFTLSAEIEARNAAGVRTSNYTGAYARGEVTVHIENADNGSALDVPRLNRPGSQAWTEGTFAFSADRFSRPAAPAGPDGPYDQLAIGVEVRDETSLGASSRPVLRNRDMDAAGTACTADAAGTSDGTCAAVNLISKPSKTTRMRFGRLRLWNAHGSEQLGLPIPVKAEYYSGGNFITNAADNCTGLIAGNVQLKDHAPAGFAATMNAANVQSGGTFSEGVGRLRLSKPGTIPAAKSAVTVCVDLGSDTPSVTAGVAAPACSAASPANMPWLQGRWSETNYDDDPSARATFGVVGNRPFIYMRERY